MEKRIEEERAKESEQTQEIREEIRGTQEAIVGIENVMAGEKVRRSLFVVKKRFHIQDERIEKA